MVRPTSGGCTIARSETVPADGAYSGTSSVLISSPELKITNTSSVNYRALVETRGSSYIKTVTILALPNSSMQAPWFQGPTTASFWPDNQGLVLGTDLTPIEVNFRTKLCNAPAGFGFNGRLPTPWLGWEFKNKYAESYSTHSRYFPAGALVPNSFVVTAKSFEWKLGDGVHRFLPPSKMAKQRT